MTRISAIRGAQDRAAEVRDPAHGITRERNHLVFPHQPREPSFDSEDVPPEVDRRENRGSDDRIETGGVAAASGDCYSHCAEKLAARLLLCFEETNDLARLGVPLEL